MSDAEGFIAGANKAGGEAVFLITLRDGAIVGACGVVLQQYDTPELGYWLGLPFWGQGYATQALHAVIDYAFTDLSHEALQAGARVTNPASRRVLAECGLPARGGRWRSTFLCAKMPEVCCQGGRHGPRIALRPRSIHRRLQNNARARWRPAGARTGARQSRTPARQPRLHPPILRR